MSAILCNTYIQPHSNVIRILFFLLARCMGDSAGRAYSCARFLTSLHSVNLKIIFICIQAVCATQRRRWTLFSFRFISYLLIYSFSLVFFSSITLEHFIETEYINLILRHWFKTRSHFILCPLFKRRKKQHSLFYHGWLLLLVCCCCHFCCYYCSRHRCSRIHYSSVHIVKG